MGRWGFLGLVVLVSHAWSASCAAEFGPPELEAVLEAVSAHHPVVRQRGQELYVEREAIAAARAAYLPTLSVEGEIIATDRDAVLQTGGDFDEDATSKSASASLQQVLYNGGRRGLEQHIARLRFAIAEQEFELSKRGVLSQAIEELYALAASRQTLILQEGLIENLTEQVDAAVARERVGDASTTDIRIAESRLQRARADRVETEFQFVSNLESLMSVSGLAPHALKIPLTDPVRFHQDKEAIVTSAIRHDPRVRIAQFNTAIGNAERALAKRFNAPVLSVAASASTARQVSPTIDESEEVAVGVTLSIPLFRGGLGSSERRRTSAALRAGQFAEQEARRQVDVEVRRLFAERRAAFASSRAAKLRERAALSAANGFLAGQRAGFYSTIDTLDAIEDKVDAEIASLQAAALLASVHARILLITDENSFH